MSQPSTVSHELPPNNTKNYYFAIAEFIEVIERTTETFALLDSFYHKYGNLPEHAELISSLPKFYRQSLPAFLRIHSGFLAKVGVTDS